jgi:deubiquitinase DESI2
MSNFGGNYGRRTRMSTKVILNIYDLSPMNEYLYPIGFGIYHSGIEMMGVEYTFASGAGIFHHSPHDVPNATFRERIELGQYDGTSHELNIILDELRLTKFGPDDYHIIQRNCNHFSNILCYKLLQKRIPGYVNRFADIGMCCSCLLPKSFLKNAPVGDTTNPTSTSSSSFLVKAPPGRMISNQSTASSSSASSVKVFHGTGARLGSSGNQEATSIRSEQEETSNSLLSRITSVGGSFMTSNTTSHSHNTNNHARHDDLTDRREKARKAALARLEQQQQQLFKQEGSDKSL